MGRLTSLPSAVITDDSALGGLTIEKSLRFNGNSSHKLTRTPPSAGNRRTFTFAFWIKRSRSEDIRYLFTAHDGNDDSNHFQIFFNAANELIVKGHSTVYKETQGTFIDVNAWYHFVVAVDTTQATSSNRIKLYTNGKEIIDLDTNTAPSQNHQFAVCAALDHNYGVNVTGSNYWWDGYMADVHLVDGLQLTPSSFGYTDFQTGTWRPKRYSGSYNTTGHYLKFTDGSALGKDYSGQGNDFTPSNFGAGDSVLDSPSNNFATYRMMGTPNNSGAQIRAGLHMITGTTGSARELQRTSISTYMMSKGSGKWYMECYPIEMALMLGCAPDQVKMEVTTVNDRFIMIYSASGKKYVKVTGSEVITNYAASYGIGDIIGILLDMEQTTPVMYVSKNGQWSNGSGSWNQSNPYTSGGAIPMTTPEMLTQRTGGNENKVCFWGSASGGGTNGQWFANFGQDSTFQNRTAAGGNKDSAGIGDFKYPVPDGALALCSNNLSRVDNTKNSESILDPKKHFDIFQYPGNSTDNRFLNSTTYGNNITLKFKPDLLWIKRRTGGNISWFVVDSSRSYTDSGGGNGNVGPLAFNENYVATNALTDGGFVGFENNGFKLGKGSSSGDAGYQRNNASGADYVAMMWKAGDSYSTNNDGSIAASVSANPAAGFSICNYTSTTGTVGHGLNSAPKMIIMKSISDSADQWTVGHDFLDFDSVTLNQESWDYGVPLNSGAARQDNAAFWNDTVPTSTVFPQGSWNNGYQKVAYCWAEVPGYSQFGEYRGNSSTDGRFIYCGFRPAFVMIREYVSGDNWTIAYNGNYNPHTPKLVPNQAYAGSVASSQYLNFYSDGFKWAGTDSGVNASNKQYIYAAFASYTGFSPYASEIPAGDYRRV